MSHIKESFLSNRFGDHYLYSVNREDFNTKGANATYQATLHPSFFRENTLHLVIGTDSGLLPCYLLKKGVPKGSRYLFVEPESVLNRIKQAQAFSSDRIHVGTPTTIYEVLNSETELGESFYFFLGNVLLHKSIAASQAHLEEYNDIYNHIEEDRHSRATLHRHTGNSRLHKINMLLNSATSFYSAHCIKDIFRNKTAVIIAPGPSFDTHIEWLKANRNKLIVISISRVCATLVKSDITPDIIISIDPITLNYTQSIQMLNYTDSLFVHSSHCNFNMTSLWPDNKINVGAFLPWNSKINKPTIPSRGFTVSNTAIDLAAWTGVSQIVLLGVDMCLSHSGDMYTKTEANHAYPITPRLLRVTTNDGGGSMTIPDYIESAKGIAQQAAELLEKRVEIINPSKRAMKIDFVKHIATKEIKLQPMDNPAADTLRQCLKNVNKEQHWTQVEKEIRHILERFRSLEKRVKSGQSIIKKIKSGAKGNNNPYSQLRKINSQLAESEVATFIKLMNWIDFARIALILEAEQYDTNIQGQERYFEVFTKSINDLKEILNLPLQYIQILREEFRAPSDSGPNIEKWQNFLNQLPFDVDYGESEICFRWNRTYPERFDALSPDKQKNIAAIEQSFTDTLRAPTSTEEVNITEEKIQKNLSNALTLLHKFCQDRDTDAIDFLINALVRYPEKDSAPYIHLCRGIKAEFEGNINEAINEYQSVLEISESKTLPQALKNIYLICLDRADLDNAIIALEALSELAPPYLAPYADLLVLYGDIETAIDNYIRYLHHFPSDPDIPEKLAELLIENDEIEFLMKICDELLKNNKNSKLLKDIRNRAAFELHKRE